LDLKSKDRKGFAGSIPASPIVTKRKENMLHSDVKEAREIAYHPEPNIMLIRRYLDNAMSRLYCKFCNKPVYFNDEGMDWFKARVHKSCLEEKENK
jgi:hypothetical protein